MTLLTETVKWRLAKDASAPASPPDWPEVADSDEQAIGLAGNIFEASGDGGAMQGAILPLAPLPVAPPVAVDLGAFWYQDFGLEWIRQNSPGTSWMGWYDWRWNWMSTNGDGNGYYMDRHPALGWYKGDDRHVLSWQVKWLVEHGCKWVILQQRGSGPTPTDGGAWNTNASVNHWIYQLTTNMPAVDAGLLKLAYWIPNSDDTGSLHAPDFANWSDVTAYTIGQTVGDQYVDGRQYRALTNNTNKRPDLNPSDWEVVSMPQVWTDMVSFYSTYSSKIKTITHDAEVYALMFFWDGESNRARWGTATMSAWLQELGTALKAAVPAWTGGVAVLAQSSPSPTVHDGVSGLGGTMDYDTLLAGNCLMLRGDYPGSGASHGATQHATTGYQSLIDNFPTFDQAIKAAAINRRVYCVPTSFQSVDPITTANYGGHSPAKFGQFLARAREEVEAARAFPLITIYNVSEWAEGGPGLQPNRQDGFGYLDALKACLT